MCWPLTVLINHHKHTSRTESSTVHEAFYCKMAVEKKHKQSPVEKPASEMSFVLMLHFVFYEANAYTGITGVVSNTVTFVFPPFAAQGTCWIFSTLTLAIYFTDRSCKVLQRSQFGNAIQMKLLQTIFPNIFRLSSHTWNWGRPKCKTLFIGLAWANLVSQFRVCCSVWGSHDWRLSQL